MLKNTHHMSRRGRWSQASAAALLIGLAAAPVAVAREATNRFAIPAQPLSSGLLVLGRQARISIAAPAPLVSGRSGKAVQGELTVRAALSQMLEGTGLDYEFVGASAVRIRTEGEGPQAFRAGAPQGDIGDEAAEEASQLAEVIVVGTRIRGQAPVGSQIVTLDRDEIHHIGRATVTDLLRTIPQIQSIGTTEGTRGRRGQGDIDNAGAGSSVNLRGLGADATLTLVNGRRLAPSASGVFVDISQIPLAAVERVEILPDGASALYGSDAIGGVVNFVLRHDYDGAETSARYGAGSGFHEYTAGQAFGRSWDTGSISLAYEYYSRTHLAGFKRPYYRSDLTAFGGSNFLPQSPAQSQAFQANPGTIVSGTTTYAIPAGQNGQGLTLANLVAGSRNFLDPQLFQDILPAQKRNSLVVSLNQDLGERVRLFADLFYSTRDFERKTQPAGRQLVVPSSNPFFIAGIPGSPTRNLVRYSFVRDFEARDEGSSENYTVTAGANFDLPRDWNGEFYVSKGRDELKTRSMGFPNEARLAAALADPNRDTAFNPYGDGAFTSGATRAKVEGFATRRQAYDIESVNLGGSGALFALPGGVVRMAIGADYRKEKLGVSSVRDQLALTPTPGTAADGDGVLSRSIKAAYAELLVPLVGSDNARAGLRKLDLSFAVRGERYSDFGETTNPKIGVQWKPLDDLLVRGSWGSSFKAPRLQQLNEAANVYRGLTLPNPGAVPGPSTPAPGFSNVIVQLGFGNKKLQPETAKTWSVGADFEPSAIPGLKASLTYFSVKYEDRILSPTDLEFIMALAGGQTSDIVTKLNPSQAELDAIYNSGKFFVLDTPFPAPQVYAIASLQGSNYGAVKLDGLDANLTYEFTTEAGVFTLGASATYIAKYEVQRLADAPFIDLLNTSSNPNDLRARASVAWTRGPLRAGLAVNHVGSYVNTFSNSKVEAWTTTDLQLGYEFQQSSKYLEGLSVNLDVENLFDDDPPFVNNGNGGANIGYDPEFASPRGRVISLTLRKTW
ncbi:TonB-dependent receptor [Phenylobacterium sp.]|uniref:TonB-dependent receptor n=1 Tax=Phenylobacterium sp. TaxID=1871053 RepID=UPI002FC9FA45